MQIYDVYNDCVDNSEVAATKTINEIFKSKSEVKNHNDVLTSINDDAFTAEEVYIETCMHGQETLREPELAQV